MWELTFLEKLKEIYYSIIYKFAKQWLDYNFWKREYWGSDISDFINMDRASKIRISIEDDAKRIHQIWSNWYKYQRDNSTPENIERWNKQSETEYKDLSEEDKEKDRDIIKKYWIL